MGRPRLRPASPRPDRATPTTKTPLEPLAYSAVDAAQLLGLAKSSVLRAIGRGEITATKVGNRWIIPRSEIDRLITPCVDAP